MHDAELKYSLAERKFQHACFISWASSGGDLTKTLVEKLKQAIIKMAPGYGLPRSVFSEEDIPIGESWELTMSRALCASITMIAVLEPEYYISDWCGREWSGMLRLEERRLGSSDQAILPLVFSPFRFETGMLAVEKLPEPVRHLEYLDVRAFYSITPDFESSAFGKIINCLMSRIAAVGKELVEHDASASDCAGFVLPAKSEFAEYKQAAKRLGGLLCRASV